MNVKAWIRLSTRTSSGRTSSGYFEKATNGYKEASSSDKPEPSRWRRKVRSLGMDNDARDGGCVHRDGLVGFDIVAGG